MKAKQRMEMWLRYMMAYFRKKLGIRSTVAQTYGYLYEYDMLRYFKRRAKWYRKAKRAAEVKSR